jgi:hypothetical protein
MKRTVAAGILLVLTGCASSGPVPIGQDTYLITKQSAGGLFVSPGTIKVEILREATAFCTSQHKLFQIINTSELGAIPAVRMPSAEVQFMCLNADDPQLQRPRMEKVPDTVIETRSR